MQCCESLQGNTSIQQLGPVPKLNNESLLLFHRRGPAVPELPEVPERVQRRRRVAVTVLTSRAWRGRLVVDAVVVEVVARRAAEVALRRLAVLPSL